MTAGATLIVPVSVEALVVGRLTDDSTVRFAGVTADFADLPRWDDAEGSWAGRPYVGDSINRFPTPTPEPGVHLHWALPDALTRGSQDAAGRLRLPPAPNRWLVVRLAQPGATRAWVIESDHVAAEPGRSGVSMPFRAEGSTQYFRYLGRALPLDGWRETAAGGSSFAALTGEAFTALGYGEATFAAYYPNCRNIFGFHDPLDDHLAVPADGTAVTLSYLVCGWFTDGAGDPLAAMPRPDPAETLKWTIAGAAGAAPGHTVCAGHLQGIAWHPDRDYFATADRPLEIAIGNTTAECLSALVARRCAASADGDTEYLLDALQSGFLAGEWRPDQTVKLEETLHQAGFASLAGGTLWQIGAAAAAPGEAGKPANVSPAIADRLAAVNALQRQYDRARDDLTARRQALFVDWTRLMRLTYDDSDETIVGSVPELADPATRAALITALTDSIALQLDEIEARDQACTALSTGPLATALAALTADVAADSAGALILSPGSSARFWQPVEPVVLLAGDDATPPRRYGGDGAHTADGTLTCRLADAIVDGLVLPGPDGATIGGEGLAVPLPLDALPVAAVVDRLIREAVLLDPARAATSDLADKVRPARDALAAGQALPGAVGLRGVPPAPPGLAVWRENPWLPLFLAWEVDYRATLTPADDDAPFPPDAVTSHYALDADGIDLAHRPALPVRTQPISGVALLTQNTVVTLTQAAGQLLAETHVPALQQAIDAIAAEPMLALVLQGFNQHLLTRRATIQLDVHDPMQPEQADFHDRLRRAIGPDRTAAAAPVDPFHGIRAGFLRLRHLSLIDVFGRVRPLDLDRTALARARGLMPTDAAMTAAGDIQLPPRLLQPARLNFRFVGADADTVDTGLAAASSPICGWIVVNNLDPGLGIHAPDGTALGALRLVGDGRKAIWQPAPVAGRPMVPAGAAPAVTGPLEGFVRGVLDHPAGGGYLAALLDVIDRGLETILPQGANPDVDLGLLVGRPLALIRASLSLELAGAAAFDTGWRALMRERRGGATGPLSGDAAPRSARSFTDVAFPVRLGDARQVADGLVGYFAAGADGTTDYHAFLSPAAAVAADGVALPPAGAVCVTAGPDAPPALVTLLADPHLPVHAASGIMPVKAIALPPEHYAQALGRLQVSFQCGPLLIPGEGLGLTLPALPGLGWSWVEAGLAGWTETADPGIGPGAGASATPPALREGWLRLSPRPTNGTP